MKDQILKFLKDNGPSIRALVNETQAGFRSESDFAERGRLLNDQWQMGRSFAQRLTRITSGWHVEGELPQPALWDVWPLVPDEHFGVVHCHPDFEGGHQLSGNDIEFQNWAFTQGQCHIMMAAFLQGDKYRVACRWPDPANWIQNYWSQDIFDLFPEGQ